MLTLKLLSRLSICVPLYVLKFSGTAFLGPPQSILLHPAAAIHNSVVDYHICSGMGLRSRARGAPLSFSLLASTALCNKEKIELTQSTDLRLMISISLTKAANKLT